MLLENGKGCHTEPAMKICSLIGYYNMFAAQMQNTLDLRCINLISILSHVETDIQFIAQFIVNQIHSETFHQISIYIYIPSVGCIWEASRV